MTFDCSTLTGTAQALHRDVERAKSLSARVTYRTAAITIKSCPLVPILSRVVACKRRQALNHFSSFVHQDLDLYLTKGVTLLSFIRILRRR